VKRMSITERDAEIKALNVLFKMFDIHAVAHYDEGKPNSNAGCWRPYPFRIGTFETTEGTGARAGSLREKMTTKYMFYSLQELIKQVHIMVSEHQTKEVA
jgi:hypothetical protein